MEPDAHPPGPSPLPAGAVILFDGICNFCNRWVDVVIKHDPHGVFRFAAQQSPGGQAMLRARRLSWTTPMSIVLLAGDRVYVDSEAIVRICARLRGPWRACALLAVIPRPVRDAVYRWIAKHRYRWFGVSEACRVPAPDLAERFIT